MNLSNPQAHARRSGFTLMELLIVITIIGILASILIPVGSQVQKYMRKVQAQKTCVELRTALMNYFSEYKRMPQVTGTGVSSDGKDFEIITQGGNPLIAALMTAHDAQQAVETYNPRKVKFFSSRTSRRPGSPGVYKEASGYALYDPLDLSKLHGLNRASFWS